MIVNTLKRVSLLVASLLTIAAGVASADPADTGAGSRAAPERNDQLEEIVVTAEKRSSTVQDTPISMTALSGDLMQQEGITDLQRYHPSGARHFSCARPGPGQTELEMRGLSSSGGASPTVGFYLDDYPLSPPAAALNGKVVIDPDLFDRQSRGSAARTAGYTLRLRLHGRHHQARDQCAEIQCISRAPSKASARGDGPAAASTAAVTLMLNMPLDR